MSTVNSPPFSARDVLASAWPLFQVSWPSCLPLAVIAVAASGSPQSAAIASGEARGFAHSGSWWGLYAASAALMLLCYGAMLLRQLALAESRALAPFDALRLAARRLPQSAATAALLLAPLGVVLALVPYNGLAAGLFAVPALALLAWLAFAWPAALLDSLGPVAALRQGAALVRGRLRPALAFIATALAGVLVFVMLAGIFLGVIMSIAGMQGPVGAVQLAVSRLLIAGVIAVPVVWLGATWVTAYRMLRGEFRPSAPSAGQ
jgi:hypothetical protein